MKEDHAAIIVGVFGDNGKLTAVRRYRTRERDLCEREIQQLLDAGRRLQVKFLDCDDERDRLDDEGRAALEELVR